MTPVDGAMRMTMYDAVAAVRPGMARPRCAVIGVGNVLMGDDAFGPTVLRMLEAGWCWDEDVELVDVGTAGYDLTAALLGREHVVILDAVKGSGEPGTLCAFVREELLAARQPQRLTPHEPGIRAALAMAELSGEMPDDVHLVGIIPVTMTQGMTLTPAVAEACRDAAREVAGLVAGWGYHVCQVADPTADDVAWWRLLSA